MSEGAGPTIDLPDDVLESVLTESVEAHDLLMAETAANGQHVHNIARHVGVKQYSQVDPLEAAAAEVVGRIKPLKS